MKYFPFIVLLLLASPIIGVIGLDELWVANSAIAQQEEGNIGFKWGFGVIVGSDEEQKFAPITRDTVLKTGDKLKMVVELQKGCIVYVIYQSSTGEISMLFPYNLTQFTADYATGKNYYIPKGRSPFTLDNNLGKETFYLLASSHRLTELESRFEKYKAAKDAKKSNLGKEVLTEIRNLKKRFRTFATIAERPISIGGNVRGSPGTGDVQRPDVASIAMEIWANNFYSKTFTIDHQ